MSCFFWTSHGIFLPGHGHGFQDASSTIGAPWRNQEPWQINRVLRQFDRWKPGIPWRPSLAKRLDVHPIFGTYLVHKWAGIQMYTGIYDINIIYIIYICTYLRGTKKICTCAIRLHPSSWFAPFGSLIQNWPRSKAIRTSHILGLGPLRASTFVSW